MFFKRKKKTEKEEIAICDSSVLIHELDACKKLKQVHVPLCSFKIIMNVSKGIFLTNASNQENALASKKKSNEVLSYILENKPWGILVPRLEKEKLFFYSTEKERNETMAVVALACEYARKGQKVCIYTRTNRTYQLALLQNHRLIKAKYISN